MAGIDTMTPYRDPREAFRQSVLGKPTPAPVAAPVVAQPMIPVGDATEIQQPRLRPTPTSAPGGSPEFQATKQRLSGIGTMPAPAAAPTAAPGVIARGASTLGAVARGTLPAAAGMVLGAAQRRIDQMPQEPSPSVAAPTGPGQIPTAPTAEQIAAGSRPIQAGTDPAVVAERRPLGFGPNNELTRNIANALNAIPGGGRILNAGRVTERLVTGGNVAQGVVRGAQTQAAVPSLPSAQAAPAGIGDIPQAAFSNEGRNGAPGTATATAATPGAGTITYDPQTKTYSGTDVKAGANIVGGTGRGRGTGRGTVNSIGTIGVEGYQQQLANIRGLGTPDSTEGQGAAGIAGTTISQDLRAKTDNMTPRDVLRVASQRGSRAAGALVEAQKVEQQGAAAVRNADVTARGQDIGAASQRASTAAQRDIAAMQGRTARDVAEISADGRAEAAAARGSSGPRYTPIQLPDEVSADGLTTRRMGTGLLNNETGEITYPGQGTGSKQQFTQGQVYTDAKGNKATWDGTKFVPVK